MPYYEVDTAHPETGEQSTLRVAASDPGEAIKQTYDQGLLAGKVRLVRTGTKAEADDALRTTIAAVAALCIIGAIVFTAVRFVMFTNATIDQAAAELSGR